MSMSPTASVAHAAATTTAQAHDWRTNTILADFEGRLRAARRLSTVGLTTEYQRALRQAALRLAMEGER
ncbi:MAG TPA: hypothetical protein VFJ19_08955 [Nocardioidaceae bacterium]|nr:hypothetical protein [Nocardioidaceae bacterium]